jgi:hypothetical protein
METAYYDPKRPGSFGGINALARESRSSVGDVRKWLSEQDAYTLHKQQRRQFNRRKTFSKGIDDLWQADLVDVSSLATYNDGNRYILTVIDVFSKYAWAKALKNKTGTSFVNAFTEIFAEKRPNFLQTDKGTEFVNASFQKLLADNDIKFYTSQNEDVKCAVVERFNRTLKSKMWQYFSYKNTNRYLDVLQDLMTAYNRSFHRSIKAAPIDVNFQNENAIRKQLYKPKKLPVRFKFRANDKVRISQSRLPFQKGYLPTWSIEIFNVKECVPTDPATYKIVDYVGDPVEGKFYAEELQKVTKSDDIYRVEKIIKTRKRAGQLEHFVKWLGYPDKFNSWTTNIIT